VTTALLDAPTARAVIALANRAPSVHNSQPWRWRIDEHSLHVFTDPERSLPATDPAGRDLRISCGAALHHLRIALLAAGWGSVVHRLPDPRHVEHLAAVELHPAQPTPDDLALAQAIDTRRSDRRMYSTWPVPDGFLDAMARAADHEEAALHLITSPSQRSTVARLIEEAALEQALSPGLRLETAGWTGRARGAREGVPAVNVPAEPGGTVPTRWFAGADQEQNRLGREESDGTVLAVLATAADTPVDQVRAGEALSAVLLTATRLGLATDPVSQPLEVPATRQGLRAELLDGAAEPQILLRLGWAPISATPVPRTGRRPVDQTIDAMESRWPGTMTEGPAAVPAARPPSG
jgi:nitroreductase